MRSRTRIPLLHYVAAVVVRVRPKLKILSIHHEASLQVRILGRLLLLKEVRNPMPWKGKMTI